MQRPQVLSWVVLSLTLIGAATLVAQAEDQVSPRKGAPKKGKISRMTANEVVLDDGESFTFAANMIVALKFDGEPSKLNIIRSSVKSGSYDMSIKDLDAIAGEATGNFVKQDIAFLKAYCQSQLALKGQFEVAEAGRALGGFLAANSNYYRYYEGVELLGDLLMAINRGKEAAAQYEKLSAAPWPDTKARGAIAKGRALLSAGVASEALAEFDNAVSLLSAPDADPGLKLSATLGRAECLAGEGKVKEAEVLVLDVIKQADPENAELHARAYNALGNSYRKAKDPKRALVQYMHTNLLYARNPLLHAQALEGLAACYTEMGDTDNGLRYQQQLRDQYPNYGKKN